MALVSDMRSKPNRGLTSWRSLTQRMLLIPEAGIIIGLLAISWAFGFPPLFGFLAIVTVFAFTLRLGLMFFAEQQLARGAYERADTLVRAALRINPWSADALALQAQGFSQQGNDEAAEHVLRRATTLYPNDRLLQSALASTVVAQGRIAEGWRLARTDDKAASTSPVIAQQLAWFALHVENDPSRARNLVLQVNLGQLPIAAALPLRTTLVEAQIALGAHDDARQELVTIEQQLGLCGKPQQAELLYHLGRLHAALGENGTSYFRRSVERDPDGRYAQVAWRSAVDTRL